MKRLLLALILASSATALWAAGATPVGRIDYVEGGVTITRAGKSLGDPNPDDPLLSGDLVKTSADGLLVIAMDKTTGMGGTITVKAKSALYLRLDESKGEKRTQVDLLAGSVASKVKKLSGSPTMQVTTGGTVAGVRGTEFEVAISVNEAALVVCAEGEVSFGDGKEEFPVPAGKAAEKRPGERLRYLPVAVSSVRQFREKWVADEVAAFRADPARALGAYEKRYAELSSSFNQAFEPFQKSEVLRKWMDEDRAGAKPRGIDPAVMREKKAIVGDLQKLRKILVIFERVYYRLDEIDGLVSGTSLERRELRPGLTAGDFLRKVRDERDALSRRVALFRYAELLYSFRNEGGTGMPGSSGGDDFFGSDEDFFGSSDF